MGDRDRRNEMNRFKRTRTFGDQDENLRGSGHKKPAVGCRMMTREGAKELGAKLNLFVRFFDRKWLSQQ
jgi:hypothetical protein